MYCVRNVTSDLYWVGANDHRLALFENCFPIPRGVSYNAYCLLDEKTVLFDTVDWSACRQLLENLNHVLNGRELDYLLINHLEPDQAACIEDGLALTGQRAQILADGSDLAVPNVDFEGVPLGVHSIDEQHLNLPPCFGFNGRTARGRAKKRTFPQRKSSKCEKRKQRTHSKNGCKLLFQFCAHHFSLHRVFSFSVCDLFRYILS